MMQGWQRGVFHFFLLDKEILKAQGFSVPAVPPQSLRLVLGAAHIPLAGQPRVPAAVEGLGWFSLRSIAPVSIFQGTSWVFFAVGWTACVENILFPSPERVYSTPNPPAPSRAQQLRPQAVPALQLPVQAALSRPFPGMRVASAPQPAQGWEHRTAQGAPGMLW